MSSEQPRINTDLAQWFRSADRARRVCRRGRFYRRTIEEAFGSTPTSLLELGSGGGNNAFHYKRRVPRSTLTDLSPAMLGLSRQVNPELEHIEGDMRTLRLGREFDAVFVHDAVCYLTTEADLAAAMLTALVHCAPGGVALFAPDHVRRAQPRAR